MFPPAARRGAARSVAEGYARDYARRFLGRLRRGTATAPADVDPDAAPPWLRPLGADPRNVRDRLAGRGFAVSAVRTASLGAAAAAAARARPASSGHRSRSTSTRRWR